MSGHLITRRLCGWLGASGTQGLSALRGSGRPAGSGAHSRGAAWMLSMLRQGVACSGVAAALLSQRNILTAWPGRVAQAHQERVERA